MNQAETPFPEPRHQPYNPCVMGKINTSVIGYGFAGKSFHSYLVTLVPELELHSIASRDAATRERIVAERGCKAVETITDVCNDPDVDLVILATPTAVHADQAIAALNAGKHVVVDKPLTLTMAETDRMIAAAEANNRILSVFQNRRFDGDYLTCREVIENGSIGDVRWLEMAWQGFGPVTGWRADAAQGGGRYWDLGAHLVDQALQFFPEPVASVYARRSYDYADSDTDSEATIIITFEGGRTAVCDLSGNTAYSKPRFCLHGATGTFVKYGVDPQELAMIAGSIDGGIEQPESYGKIYTGSTITQVKTQPGRWRNYYENIAAAINGTAPLAVSMESVRKAMQVLTAGIESAETGNVIHF